MSKGKFESAPRPRRKGSKAAALILALVLVVGCVVGGTLAWLTAKSGPVTNTFTTADIGVTLTETFNTDSNGDKIMDTWQAQMIPGFEYKKDPVVTVKAGSVDCYLFVKFEENNDPSTYLTYTSTLTADNGWTQGNGTDVPDYVWYRVVSASDSDQSWHLLEDDKITVNGEAVTKENMETAAKAALVYTAYASQLHKNATGEFTAAEAWENIQ